MLHKYYLLKQVTAKVGRAGGCKESQARDLLCLVHLYCRLWSNPVWSEYDWFCFERCWSLPRSKAKSIHGTFVGEPKRSSLLFDSLPYRCHRHTQRQYILPSDRYAISVPGDASKISKQHVVLITSTRYSKNVLVRTFAPNRLFVD